MIKIQQFASIRMLCTYRINQKGACNQGGSFEIYIVDASLIDTR